jgi:hypothetical protein
MRAAGCGAPVQCNTLLNNCGVTPEKVRRTADRSRYEQHHDLLGTRIPIRARGGRFVVPIPALCVLN